MWKLWAAATVSVIDMWRSRIDISQGLDGEPVVLACFDLGGEEIAASAHAVAATATERFRTASMSVDEVLEFRELTALADELADLARRPGCERSSCAPRGCRPIAPPSPGSSTRATTPSRSAKRTASRSRASAACSSRSRSLRRGAARRAVAWDRAAPLLTPPATLVR